MLFRSPCYYATCSRRQIRDLSVCGASTEVAAPEVEWVKSRRQIGKVVRRCRDLNVFLLPLWVLDLAGTTENLNLEKTQSILVLGSSSNSLFRLLKQALKQSTSAWLDGSESEVKQGLSQVQIHVGTAGRQLRNWVFSATSADFIFQIMGIILTGSISDTAPGIHKYLQNHTCTTKCLLLWLSVQKRRPIVPLVLLGTIDPSFYTFCVGIAKSNGILSWLELNLMWKGLLKQFCLNILVSLYYNNVFMGNYWGISFLYWKCWWFVLDIKG